MFHLLLLKYGNKNTGNGLKIINKFYLLCFVLFSFNSQAELSINDDFNYLNTLRLDAGLIAFSRNHLLDNTAQNHANYLSLNNKHGHYEQQGLTHFTGDWVSERAIAAQYPNRMVSENVTSKSGDSRFYNPIDSLMSAIYHRFAFLDLIKNEIGIGHKTGRNSAYVYVMGNTKLSYLCQQDEFKANGEYNYKICINSKKRIEKRLVDNDKQQTMLSNAKIVLWPANGASDIPPVFFQESPDPLPNHSVSGYPVSVQFNPAYFKVAPKIIAFSLLPSNSNKALKTITILNENNDPNDLLTSYQHALFPEKRLDWNTKYTAQLTYLNNDTKKQHKITWSFMTRSFKAKIITITENQQQIYVKKGRRYILYFPPKHANDTKAAVSFSDHNMNLKLNYIDNNTLNAFINNKGDAKIIFHNKTITLISD